MGEGADAGRPSAVNGPDEPMAVEGTTPRESGPQPSPGLPGLSVRLPASSVPAGQDPNAGVSAAAVVLLAERPDVRAAREAARAARMDLEDEIERLEAALRSAVDFKAKVRRHPARAAGVAAGIGFLAVGGPRRVLRRAREAVFGKPDPLPEAMLPDEIEKRLKALGPDGAKVRGALERDFAAYLEKTAPKRRDLRSTLVFLLLPTARVLIQRFGRQLIDEVLSPGGGFAEQLDRVRARRAAAATGPASGDDATGPRSPGA